MTAPTLPEISAAAERLRDILQTRTQGDYSPSSVLGDLVVDPHAIIVSDLLAQIRGLRTRQSLADLRGAPASADANDAVDALLANLFVARSVGTFARGVATLHFTQRVDTLLPRNTRLVKSGGLVYYPNIAENRLIEASELRPRYDDRGTVTSWTIDINVIASRTGSAYRTRRGRFQSVDGISPYLAYAENIEDFVAGDDPDTNESAVANAETALSLRAMVNARSNDATLRNRFTEITRVRSVGMGEPEMRRDLILPGIFGAPAHRGGHVDVYVDLPLQTVTERLVVGEPSRRADGRVITLADSAPTGSTFTAAGVVAGDILHISAGIPEAPMAFRIAAVRDYELDVVSDVPFSIATDENGSPALTYSIGYNYPAFDNRTVSHVAAGATTTRLFSIENAVVLPAGPVGAIVRVEVPDPPASLTAFVDATTGAAVYSTRRNGALTRAPLASEPLSFRYLVQNPTEAQSQLAVHYLDLGWPGASLAGTEVLVTYETMLGFDVIDAAVRSEPERVLNANYLPRGAFLVYVSCSVPYQQRTIPQLDAAGNLRTDSDQPVAAVDETRVVTAIVDVVETAPLGGLSVTSINAAALRADANISGIYPYTLRYNVTLPDGRIVYYESEDRVELTPDTTTSARVVNYLDLGLTQGDIQGFKRLLKTLGLSTRIARFRTTTDLIAMETR